MNEETNETNSGHRRGGKCGLGRKGRLGVAVVALVSLGAVLGALITVATDATAHGRMGGWRGHGAHHTAASIEEARERALDGAAWVAGSVDATPEQEQRIEEILTGMVETLYPLREEHRAHRRELVSALARPEIDRGVLERIRSEEIALADRASQALLDAVADASDVLTMEQRQALVGIAMRHGH